MGRLEIVVSLRTSSAGLAAQTPPGCLGVPIDPQSQEPSAAYLVLLFFTAAFFATAGAGFLVSARFAAHLLFAASEIAFLPAAESFRFGFENSGVAFDGRLEGFAGGFFAFPADACKPTASFA
jgi:hypothetical protein